MCFDIRKYLSTKKLWPNSGYYLYFVEKYPGVMNIVCYAVIIKKITYIPWNVTYLSLLYIYMCVCINKCVLIQGIIYLQKKIWPISVYYSYLLYKYPGVMNIVYYAVIIKNVSVYSMKCYTLISSTYVGINKCVLIQGIIYLQKDMTSSCLPCIFTR